MKSFKFSILDNILVILILIGVLGLFNLYFANYMYKDTILNYSKKLSSKVCYILVSKIISEELEIYKDIDFIYYDNIDSDFMECIEFDTYNLIKLQNSVLENVNNALFALQENEEIEYLDKVDSKKGNLLFEIPYGIINNNALLNVFGPDIPIVLKLIGDSSCQLEYSIEGENINTIMLKIVLHLKINFMIFIPLESEEVSLYFDFPIGVKLIQGNVPEGYFGSYPII